MWNSEVRTWSSFWQWIIYAKTFTSDEPCRPLNMTLIMCFVINVHSRQFPDITKFCFLLGRYFGVVASWSWKDIVDTIKRNYPEYSISCNGTGQQKEEDKEETNGEKVSKSLKRLLYSLCHLTTLEITMIQIRAFYSFYLRPWGLRVKINVRPTLKGLTLHIVGRYHHIISVKEQLIWLKKVGLISRQWNEGLTLPGYVGLIS